MLVGRDLLRVAATASATVPGPVDPLPSRNIQYKSCTGSSWMTEAGTTGSGAQTEISFFPTEKERWFGEFFYGDVWNDLQKCAPFPDLSPYEAESVFLQFICHVDLGRPGTEGKSGPTFDFQAWRPKASEFTTIKDGCSPKLGSDAGDQYLGKIIQWTADPNAQKTAWLIDRAGDGELERRWIPTSQIFYCLKAKGVGGPIELDHDFIAGYMAENGTAVGQKEACGASAPTTPPSTTLAPGATLPPGEYYVQNAEGGVYWRSAPDWNTAAAVPGQGLYPGTIVRPTCYQAGSANVSGSTDGMWEQANWVGGPGSGSGWINEHFIADGAALNQPSPGVPPCATPPSQPPPGSTRVDLYNNYGAGAEGHAMCRGNPGRPESMPGGVATETFTVPPGAGSVDTALVQIDPDSSVTAHATLSVDGIALATADAVAAGDTTFNFPSVGVHPGDSLSLSISFSATSGKITTLYTVGVPGGTFTASNSCPDGAPSFTTASGLRAVISGWTQ
jgi:hypothetical protein